MTDYDTVCSAFAKEPDLPATFVHSWFSFKLSIVLLQKKTAIVTVTVTLTLIKPNPSPNHTPGVRKFPHMADRSLRPQYEQQRWDSDAQKLKVGELTNISTNVFVDEC